MRIFLINILHEDDLRRRHGDDWRDLLLGTRLRAAPGGVVGIGSCIGKIIPVCQERTSPITAPWRGAADTDSPVPRRRECPCASRAWSNADRSEFPTPTAIPDLRRTETRAQM